MEINLKLEIKLCRSQEREFSAADISKHGKKKRNRGVRNDLLAGGVQRHEKVSIGQFFLIFHITISSLGKLN